MGECCKGLLHCCTQLIVFLGLCSLLVEDLLCLLNFNSDEYSQQFYFWVVYGFLCFTIINQFLSLACSYGGILIIIADIIQCVAFIYFTNDDNNDAKILDIIGIEYCFIFLAIIQIIGHVFEVFNDNINDERMEDAAPFATGASAVYFVFGSVISIPLLYFKSSSPYASLQYEVLYTLAFWFLEINVFKMKVQVSIGQKNIDDDDEAQNQDCLDKLFGIIFVAFIIYTIVIGIIYYPDTDSLYEQIVLYVHWSLIGGPLACAFCAGCLEGCKESKEEDS